MYCDGHGDGNGTHGSEDTVLAFMAWTVRADLRDGVPNDRRCCPVHIHGGHDEGPLTLMNVTVNVQHRSEKLVGRCKEKVSSVEEEGSEIRDGCQGACSCCLIA